MKGAVAITSNNEYKHDTQMSGRNVPPPATLEAACRRMETRQWRWTYVCPRFRHFTYCLESVKLDDISGLLMQRLRMQYYLQVLRVLSITCSSWRKFVCPSRHVLVPPTEKSETCGGRQMTYGDTAYLIIICTVVLYCRMLISAAFFRRMCGTLFSLHIHFLQYI